MPRIEVQIRGYLDVSWAERLGGPSLSHTSLGTTALTGIVRDQTALHGLLATLSSLNLDLLSLTAWPVVPAPPEGGEGP